MLAYQNTKGLNLLMILKEVCEKLNAEYDETLARFGGMESMYAKFLKKFLEDSTFSELQQAYQDKNYPEIESTAHTLKGVAGNLGLTNLFSVSNTLVQKIREHHIEEVPIIYEKIVKEYEFTVNTIKELD